MIRIAFIIISLLFWTVAAEAACPAGSTCENYNGTIPYAATGGTSARTPANRAVDAGVNILEFGADPTGVSDSAAAIQAAIDYSVNSQGFRKVYCPEGVYKTTLPIFLDAPNSLRGTASAWSGGTTYAINAIVKRSGVPFISLQNSNTNNDPLSDLGTSDPVWWATTTATPSPASFNGSFSFEGSLGLSPGSNNDAGCIFQPTFTNAEAFWVGPGNGNVVENLHVIGSNQGTRCNYPTRGVGIAIAGGSSGASRTKLVNVGVYNFYYGVKVSATSFDALADSNTIEKANISNVCLGVVYNHTQAFINDILHSNISANEAVVANLGTGVNIYGGNYTAYENSLANAFAVSGCGTSTTNNTITLTCTVTSPDSYLTNTRCASNTQCVYNAFAVKTADFGIVPLVITGYSSGTITLQTGANAPSVGAININNWWNMYGNTLPSTLQTELAAATTLYASEMVTTFWGNHIHVAGIHIENFGVPTQLIRSSTNFGGTSPNIIENILFNYDPSLPPGASPSGSQLAVHYIQQSFPFIYADGTAPIAFHGMASATITDDLIIDVGRIEQFSWSGNGHVNWPFGFRSSVVGANATFSSGYTSVNTAGLGSGELDTPVTAATQSFSDLYRSSGWGLAPYWGFRPAPYSRPCLTPSQITTLNGTLPAITNTGSGASITYTVSYPLMWGGQQYQACDWNSPAHNSVVSSHKFYSYGQNLTTTNVPNLSWTLKRQSPALVLNVEALRLMFPGLGLTLTCNSLTKAAIVTEVHINAGYVMLMDGDQDGSPYLMDFGQDCSGTTIGQPSYVLTQF